ncbi:MAG: gluconeogenesis factor YvcK family protein [bacterium]
MVNFFKGKEDLKEYISNNFLVRKSRVVVIGGGSGISNILKGLKSDFDYIVSISTVTDDGGSTGKILKIYEDILPVGDLRNCLANLSSNEILEKLLQYRFDKGELSGHALGNFILLALYKIANHNLSLMSKYINDIFRIRGLVLPSAKKRGILVAKISNGDIIKGETNINNFISSNPDFFIEDIYLEDLSDIDVNEQAIQSILNSDMIIVGPGSIYSSILPNFLLTPILDAYKKSNAIKIYISNIMNQPNEIKENRLSSYLKILKKYGLSFDYILFNSKPIKDEILKKYVNKDKFYKLIENDLTQEFLLKENIVLIETDLVNEEDDLIRHDPIKVLKTLKKIYLSKVF